MFYFHVSHIRSLAGWAVAFWGGRGLLRLLGARMSCHVGGVDGLPQHIVLADSRMKVC
jgi:hypothetical protein